MPDGAARRVPAAVATAAAGAGLAAAAGAADIKPPRGSVRLRVPDELAIEAGPTRWLVNKRADGTCRSMHNNIL